MRTKSLDPAKIPFIVPAESAVAVQTIGAAMLMASYDSEGPQLYLIEPGGTAHVSSPTPHPSVPSTTY